MSVLSIRTFLADERGGPLAEMAVLILPFLIIIGMIVEGGNLIWRHQIALKAVRDTARYLSRAPLLVDDACTLNANSLGVVKTSAKLLGSTGSLDGGAPLVPNWTSDNIDIPIPIVVDTDPCTVIVQAIADVDLPLPFAPVFQLFDPDLDDSISFSVADQTRWLGD